MNLSLVGRLCAWQRVWSKIDEVFLNFLILRQAVKGCSCHSPLPRNFTSQIHELLDYVHTTFVFESDLGSHEEFSDTRLDSIVAPSTISL
jgi:hypothetical protein